MQNISEMNQNTECSAKNRDIWSPCDTVHTQSDVCQMYCLGAENTVTWLMFIHVLDMGHKTRGDVIFQHNSTYYNSTDFTDPLSITDLSVKHERKAIQRFINIHKCLTAM